jgi:hypothetical protein
MLQCLRVPMLRAATPLCAALSCSDVRVWGGALRQHHYTTAVLLDLASSRAASAPCTCSAPGCWSGARAKAPFGARSTSSATVVHSSAAATSELPAQTSEAAAPASSEPEQAAADALAAWIQSIEPQPAQLVPRRIPGRGG